MYIHIFHIILECNRWQSDCESLHNQIRELNEALQNTRLDLQEANKIKCIKNKSKKQKPKKIHYIINFYYLYYIIYYIIIFNLLLYYYYYYYIYFI